MNASGFLIIYKIDDVSCSDGGIYYKEIEITKAKERTRLQLCEITRHLAYELAKIKDCPTLEIIQEIEAKISRDIMSKYPNTQKQPIVELYDLFEGKTKNGIQVSGFGSGILRVEEFEYDTRNYIYKDVEQLARSLVDELNSRHTTREEINRFWIEMILDDLDYALEVQRL